MIATRVGFAGGQVPHPTYRQVCTKTTGHAETVEVVYDLRQLTTQELLREFFTLHDFTVDRRDNGGQYRSAIFVPQGSPRAGDQERDARSVMEKLRAHGYVPVTEVRRAAQFFPAESRHQQYCSSRGTTPKRRDSARIREILTLFDE